MKIFENLDGVAAAVHAYVAAATQATRDCVMVNGQLDAQLAHRNQRALHGLAWIATTAQAILTTARWGQRLAADGGTGGTGGTAEPPHLAHRPAENLLLGIGIGEYLQQLAGGIPMSQNEIFRPGELGLMDAVQALRSDTSVAWFLEHGNTVRARHALIEQVRAGVGINEA